MFQKFTDVAIANKQSSTLVTFGSHIVFFLRNILDIPEPLPSPKILATSDFTVLLSLLYPNT